MTTSTHKTEGVNRTKTVRFYPFVFTGEVPCKEVRTPLTSITFSEERDEETCYGYCDQYQPHAVRRMYDYKKDRHFDLRWDKAGNLGQVSTADREDQFESARFLFWTEDNRMHAAVDEKYYSYYVYDYSGERRLKLTGESSRMDVNANLMTISTSLDNPTLYPSPYLVLTRTEYTKHYYAGTDRVAACLGGGGLDIVLGNNLTEPTAPAYSTPWGGLFDNGSTDPEEVIVNDTIVMLQEASTKLFEQSGWQVNQRELNGNELNCIAEIDAYHAELHRTIAGIPDRMETGITLDFDKFHDKVRDLKKIQHDEREYVYYYHGDHLGSASWITNHNGDAVQHLQYLPYGEPYVDKRTSGYSERFRFTGKERDEETGYGYFGARYMDHELTTMWLSIDPLADKYPSISPYAYCAWNPVKLVDPDGREIADFYNLKGEWVGTDGIDDGRIFLVTNESDVSMILANGENCDIQTTQVSEVKSAIELPSVALREEMVSQLTDYDNSNPFREYGGVIIGESNQEIGWAKPGPEFNFGEPAQINPHALQDPSILTTRSDDCSEKWRFHSHPSGTRWKGDKSSQIIQTPDEFDTGNMMTRPTSSGYAFQLGMRSKMVNIYNGEGTHASISFELFRTIGK